jgi:O-antigen/teichoic acid export membrane protein
VIGRLLRDKTAHGFMQVLGSNALTSLSQGVQFLMLARALGPSEFGRIAAASGITQVLFPFAGIGSANVMVMRASRDPALMPLYLGNTLAVSAVTGLMLVTMAALAVGPLLHGQIPAAVMLVWACSELIGSRVVDICWQAFLARDQLRYTSVFLTLQSLTRLCAAGLFVWFAAEPSAREWAWWALASNFLVGAAVLTVTVRRVGKLRIDWKVARQELGIGASFAVGQAAKSFYTDADKVFLARYATADVVGQYTMAYRVVQIALTAVRALSLTLQTRLFRAGEGGIGPSLQLTIRVLRPTALCAAALAVIFYVSAPLLTVVAGHQYLASVDALRVLSLMPLVLAVQILLYDALSTSGHQRVAAIVQIISAAVICGLSVATIPTLGWVGAALASYGSQVTLCVLLALAIRAEHRKPRIARLNPGT